MPFRPCIHSFFFLPFPEFDSVLFQKYSSPQKAKARDEELHLSWQMKTRGDKASVTYFRDRKIVDRLVREGFFSS